ncbi:hypothetical protein [Cellulosilyticum sp. I15G10I2]|uniref:hypothetical protein n=1 Tax=Cellulosilyticum sp. I15G10I2 TaxID=1892843 RepID=UPI00085BB886|nr:hypothetical protein [Cellulosilyticum sp. I15G10I2]
MYFDFIKTSYSDEDELTRQAYENRDKEHLGKIIIDKIAGDINAIVERWWKLESIGYLGGNEKFLDLLKEAEELFCFSNFTGCIALIGIAAEEFSKYLAETNNLNHKNLSQEIRLKSLLEKSVINKELYNNLNGIRILRNQCIHYNQKFKDLNLEVLESKAISILNHYKTAISSVLERHEMAIEDILEKTISEQKFSFEEFKLKNRNYLKTVEGIDLTISPNKSAIVFESLYYIAEIDIKNDDFKEMSLVDIDSQKVIPFPFVLDLTLPDVQRVKEMRLEEKNVIRATVIANVTSAGLTEEWKLLDIKDVYRGKYEL